MPGFDYRIPEFEFLANRGTGKATAAFGQNAREI
jgi:hypothetical protein